MALHHLECRSDGLVCRPGHHLAWQHLRSPGSRQRDLEAVAMSFNYVLKGYYGRGTGPRGVHGSSK